MYSSRSSPSARCASRQTRFRTSNSAVTLSWSFTLRAYVRRDRVCSRHLQRDRAIGELPTFGRASERVVVPTGPDDRLPVRPVGLDDGEVRLGAGVVGAVERDPETGVEVQEPAPDALAARSPSVVRRGEDLGPAVVANAGLGCPPRAVFCEERDVVGFEIAVVGKVGDAADEVPDVALGENAGD